MGDRLTVNGTYFIATKKYRLDEHARGREGMHVRQADNALNGISPITTSL